MFARQRARHVFLRLLKLPGQTPMSNSKSRISARCSSGDASSNQIYRRLDPRNREIRLLWIASGFKDEPVHCRLEHLALTDRDIPRYDTVSYVWGNTTLRATIYVDGNPMDVHQSAEIVLRRLRFPEHNRYLWIDAVCIDQGNPVERSHQVSLMHLVYRCGDNNLIWLGEDDKCKIQSVLDSIRTILLHMQKATDNLQNVIGTMYHSNLHIKADRSGRLAGVNTAALMHLFSNPWFSRLWIVQEVALARRNIVYHGDSIYLFEAVIRAASWLQHKLFDIDRELANSDAFSNVCKISSFADQEYGIYNLVQKRSEHPVSAHDLLYALQQFNAQDARDHIYATLGLYMKYSGTEDIPPALAPNYEAPLADVFRQACKFCCSQTGSLETLCIVSHRTEEDMDGSWPTWVPRWDRRFDRSQDATGLAEAFDACKGYDWSLPAIYFSEYDDILVRGQVEGCVATVSQLLTTDILDNVARVQRLLERFDVQWLPSAPSTPRLQNRNALAAAFYANDKETTEEQAREYYQDFVNYFAQRGALPPRIQDLQLLSGRQERSAAHFRQTMQYMCLNRRIFLTNTGLLGIGPRFTRPKDTVAVLYGSKLPFVLRTMDVFEIGKDPDVAARTCQLVGHCYMEGIMYGEAVERHRLEQKEETIFCLM